MPTILRRPTHMILVTGMTPNGLNNVQEASNDDFLSPLKSSAASNSKQNSAGSENGINRLNNRRFNGANGGGEGSSTARIQMNRTCGLIGTDDESRKLMETKFQVSPRIPKWVGVIGWMIFSAIQYVSHYPYPASFIHRSICRSKPQQQVKSRVLSPMRPPAELPLPQTSTLRSRKRLANILVAAGIIYALCWLPHVYCLITREFSINEGCSIVASEFFMLLGELRVEIWSWNFMLIWIFIRFRSLSRLANNPLDSQLQLTKAVNMSALCQAELSTKVPPESTEIYRSTSATALEYQRGGTWRI